MLPWAAATVAAALGVIVLFACYAFRRSWLEKQRQPGMSERQQDVLCIVGRESSSEDDVQRIPPRKIAQDRA